MPRVDRPKPVSAPGTNEVLCVQVDAVETKGQVPSTFAGNPQRTRSTYKKFLTLWKDADPDIPIFIAEKVEFGKLH
jgi:hypothetical protein